MPSKSDKNLSPRRGVYRRKTMDNVREGTVEDLAKQPVSGRRPDVSFSPTGGCARGLRSSWVLYIVKCSDGTLYTGVTNDLERRLRQHNEGMGARYTRARRPVRLAYSESCKNRSEAQIRERKVKLLSREKKMRLIEGICGSG